ncbi:hypothetical protein DFH06DRAFT_1123569 [Mycena polygramma]|nr:hypothetical protein DFH06DRAFT_1132687 [Mycena polygramma]KAJ7673904.1 hypothetical protein DFH06DRAFT_1123569 [Mycena polygramma]
MACLSSQPIHSQATSGLTRGIPDTLDLPGPDLLPPSEKTDFELRIACNIRSSTQAEEDVAQYFLAAYKAAAEIHEAEKRLAKTREDASRALAQYHALREAEARAFADCHHAEVGLAMLRKSEAESRVDYYRRMCETAARNTTDARFQVGAINSKIWEQEGSLFEGIEGIEVNSELSQAKTSWKRTLFGPRNEGNPAPPASSSTRSKARRVRPLNPAKKTYAAKAGAAKDKHQRAHRKPLTPRQAVRALHEEVRELRAALARTETQRDAAQATIARVPRPTEGPGDLTEQPRNLYNEPKLYTATWPDRYNCPPGMTPAISIFDYYDAIIYDDDPDVEALLKNWPSRYKGTGPLAPSHSPDSSPSPNVSPSRNDGATNNCVLGGARRAACALAFPAVDSAISRD